MLILEGFSRSYRTIQLQFLQHGQPIFGGFQRSLVNGVQKLAVILVLLR